MVLKDTIVPTRYLILKKWYNTEKPKKIYRTEINENDIQIKNKNEKHENIYVIFYSST